MKAILAVKGISDTKAEKIKDEARKIVPLGFTTASMCLEARKEVVRITTGSKEIDNLLGGGVETRSEEHTSELQSRETISYAVFCLKKKKKKKKVNITFYQHKYQ